jgi:histone H3/H4
LQHSAQAQAQTQTQAQAQAQVQAQTRAQAQAQAASHNYSQLGAQPHQQYQTHHYNNTNNSSNSSTVTATITNHNHNHNHNAYHLPPQQHSPLAAFTSDNLNITSHTSLSPYPHQSGVQYYPSQQSQPQPQPQYPLSPQHSYHQQAAPSYYPSYTEPPTSTPYLPTSQSFPQQKPQQQQEQEQQQQPNLVCNQPATSKPQSAMPRGKAAAQVVKEPEIMESPVRTKFPTARIKRIMQADEEVGKVAQQTPIAVGKALELFMVQLVRKSAEVAKDKNSKRITAPMLKQAIDSTNEWDFLREIVAKVAEEKEGAKSSGRTKAETDSDDDADAAEVKKKGRGGRKRKAPA